MSTALAISIRFPGGRYHATPWDAHVNEGRVEWPPSPWRLLRALIATRDLKAREEVPEAVLRRLVQRLAEVPPSYALPSRMASFHTRHYMPIWREKPKRVLDTFLHLPRDARVVVLWTDAAFDEESIDALTCLVERLGYLGRAEAWVEGEVLREDIPTANCLPVSVGRGEGTSSAVEGEWTRLLAPVPAGELVSWRDAALKARIDQAIHEQQVKRGSAKGVKLSPAKRAKLESGLPATVFDALRAETTVCRKDGWNRPPGSWWIRYVRPTLDTGPAHTASVRRAARLPTVARFALAGTVRPRLTNALREAEKIRLALLSHSDGAPVFSGRDPETDALLSGHPHAFILPEANGRRGHITHVTIFAKMGFDARARNALEQIRAVWQRGGKPLQLVLLGMGLSRGLRRPAARLGTVPAAVHGRYVGIKDSLRCDPPRETASRRAPQA